MKIRRTKALFCALLGVAASLPAAPPAAGQVTEYPTEIWSELPPSVVSETGYRAGFGTGVTSTGEPVRLRPGSPFVRIGERLVQLANVPYLAGGRLHVPAELFDLPAFEPRPGTASGTAGSPASDLPPVVDGETARRPGPWRVIIDPGHGGWDPGTHSPRTGLQERRLTLTISQMLYEELDEIEGIDPWLTRTSNEYVSVHARPIMAVERDGDLFISIHIDANESTSPRGFTTYYLGPSRTEEGRRKAMRENTIPGVEEASAPDIDQLEFILAGLDQGSFLEESRRFGGFIQNELRQVVDSPDRGVRPGPYWVLMRATSNMPTVLVEMGFLTNPSEERRLRDPEHQRVMAKALAEAISRYLDEKEDRLDALAGGR